MFVRMYYICYAGIGRGHRERREAREGPAKLTGCFGRVVFGGKNSAKPTPTVNLTPGRLIDCFQMPQLELARALP